MSVYKIRNKDGKYSCGGAHAAFHGNGKTWSTMGALKAHLTHYRDAYGREREVPEDWEIVEFVQGPVVAKARDLKAKDK